MLERKFGMERLTVIDLKAEAKRRGLRGYSRLRKAELINLLTQRGERVNRNVEQPEVIFVEEPEVIFVEEPEVIFVEQPEICQPVQPISSGSLLKNKKKRKLEKKA